MSNRHEDPHLNMYEGHLLALETYIGGHIKALEAGVFQSDILTDFKIVPVAVQQVCPNFIISGQPPRVVMVPLPVLQNNGSISSSATLKH